MKFMQYAVLVMSMQSGIALGVDVKEPQFTPEDCAQYASYIKKIVAPYEEQNKQILHLDKHFTLRSDLQDEKGRCYKNLFTVYLKTKDVLRFADGSAKPGFEVVIKQGRFERVAPCDTGVPSSFNRAKKILEQEQMSKFLDLDMLAEMLTFADLEMLALHIRASGQKVIQLSDGIECELKDRPKIKGTTWPVYSELIFRYAKQEDRDNLKS